jgi:hypothetical protein
VQTALTEGVLIIMLGLRPKTQRNKLKANRKLKKKGKKMKMLSRGVEPVPSH